MGLQYSPKIVTSGLDLLVDAKDPNSYPGSGLSVYDLSLNGRTLGAGGMDETALQNGAFTFSSDYDAFINLDAQNFTYLYDFTMESLCKPTGNHSHYDGALLSSGDWNVDHWALSLNQNNTAISIRRPYWTVNYTFTVNNWYHVVYRRAGTALTVFVNGVIVGTANSTADRPLVSNASNTMIGRETYAGGYFNFEGEIAHTKIYSVALNDAEVLQNYRALGKRVS